MATRRIKVLIAKPGLDGHNRGVKVVVHALRDAGMEVIYTGIRQTPKDIVKAAIEEDVDVIGLSNLSGAHLTLFPQVAELVRKEIGDNLLLICGGIIPQKDREELTKAGFAAVFTPGAPTTEIIEFIRKNLPNSE
ncbi:MAG: cobalamin B12-binding domain-containing protein [Planctomycetota bacterium]